jgi:Tfp pilus assembly protein PilO
MLLAVVVAIGWIYVPLAQICVKEGKMLFHHYTRKNAASTYPEALKNGEKDILLLDSLLEQIDNRKLHSEGTLVDELYRYADSAGFRTEKVEAGIPQQVAGHSETAISIEGIGTYTATGLFVEKIENNPQSTRIRQLTIKAGETRDPEVFVDVVVREEAGTEGRKAAIEHD